MPDGHAVAGMSEPLAVHPLPYAVAAAAGEPITSQLPRDRAANCGGYLPMLTPDTLATFASLDTSRQASILADHQLLDTDAGDAVMGHLAGVHPERYDALVVALARGGDAA